MMNKLNSQKIKEEIAQYCDNNKDVILKEFYVTSDEERVSIETNIGVAKNWKRFVKEKGNNFWVRAFDCDPLDNQLRAYVTTNIEDTDIISIIVQGE